MPKPDVEGSIWIARSPEDIWNYLCDASNEVLWRYGVYLSQWISEPPYGIGSLGFHIVALWGDYPWKVVEFEEQRIMSWDVIDGRFKGARAGYRISPEDTGSRMTIYFNTNQNVLLRIMMFVMKGLFIRQITDDLGRLKAIMEA
jgi:hypothetical protein